MSNKDNINVESKNINIFLQELNKIGKRIVDISDTLNAVCSDVNTLNKGITAIENKINSDIILKANYFEQPKPSELAQERF